MINTNDQTRVALLSAPEISINFFLTTSILTAVWARSVMEQFFELKEKRTYVTLCKPRLREEWEVLDCRDKITSLFDFSANYIFVRSLFSN